MYLQNAHHSTVHSKVWKTEGQRARKDEGKTKGLRV